MKKCAECGSPFHPRQGNQRFCGRQCANDWFANERKTAVQLMRAAAETDPEAHSEQEAAHG